MYLYGASGHAKVVIDILKSKNNNIIGLIDDNASIQELLGFPVSQKVVDGCSIIISIGDNLLRKKIVNSLSNVFYRTAIHSSSIISEACKIGEGSVIMQGAIIQSCAKIGRHCIVNTGASVDHDCNIADFVHISPHSTLCGNVSVGEGSWIGAGATIISGVKIGKWCIIGAGSVITKDTPDHVLIYGNKNEIIKTDINL